MRVFVTGASGFIGRNLVEALSVRHRVLAPTRSEVDLLDGDAVRAFLRRERPDVVVHAATTPGHRNAPAAPELALCNLRMFFHLAGSADCFSRMIVLGSGAEYDQRHYAPKMREEEFGRHVPADQTGLSKFAIARAVEAHAGWVHLRPFGVYGEHEDWEIRFISNAICKALFGRPITLRQDRRFDYVPVHDLAVVVEQFLDRPARHWDYNVTPDESVPLRRVAELVVEISGKDLPIVVAQPGLGTEYSGDNARLRSELPERQLTPLREGIERLYRWYAERRAQIREDALLKDK